MNPPQHPKDPPQEAGNILVVLSIVVVAVGAMIAGLTTMAHSGSSAITETEQSVRCDYLAYTGINRAFAEIGSQEDPTGHGLGAMGLATPVPFADSTGTVVGEFMTIVTQQGGNNVILSVAGVPNLTSPDVMASAESVISTNESFLLKPKPGAIAVAGPITQPRFPGIGNNELRIDGGVYPAFSVSNLESFENVMEKLGSAMYHDYITGDEFQGGLTSTYDHSLEGEITLPIWQQEYTTLSSQILDDYRNSLRTGVLEMADNADRTISSRITGDQTWGTVDAPEVTVLDVSAGNRNSMFDTNGMTVTGAGTLIIKHAIRPGKNGDNLNLKWDGDVVVVGFDGDGSDLLYLHGTHATINGNLVLLASDNTEASLEMRDWGGRESDLTVNGALLTLAEADSHESEVEVEGSSRLTVNGLLGMFGSRIELEASGSQSELTVNGTLSIGVAQDINPGVARGDDFEFQMDGKVSIVYDMEKVSEASAGLAGLQMELFDSQDEAIYDITMSGGFSGSKTGEEGLAELYEYIQTNGTSDAGYQTPSSSTTQGTTGP